MKYVLIVYLLSGYAPGPVFHDFDTEKACENARHQISVVTIEGHAKDKTVTMCVPKG